MYNTKIIESLKAITRTKFRTYSMSRPKAIFHDFYAFEFYEWDAQWNSAEQGKPQKNLHDSIGINKLSTKIQLKNKKIE